MSRARKRIEQFIGLFSPRSLALHPEGYAAESSPIFIGGCGRSGTTLLRVMLGGHSRVYAGPEFNVHTNMLASLPAWLPQKAFLLYDTEMLSMLSERFEISTSDIIDMRKKAEHFPHFFDLFFQEVANRHGAERWAEKTPKNVTIIPYLFRYFPNARFIHVIRDGRDVVCSLRHHPRFKRLDGRVIETGVDKPIAATTKRWVGDVRAGLAFRDDSRYIEIKYEDVIQKSDEVTKRLLDFLDLPQEELKWKKRAGDPEHFLQSRNAVEEPVATRIGRYKKDMSHEDARYFADNAGGLLAELGYVKDQSWVNELGK